MKTVVKTFQGYKYDFVCDARQLETNKSIVKIKNAMNIKTIIDASNVREKIRVGNDNTINSRHINHFLFNVQNRTNLLIQTAWTVIVDEILEKYSTVERLGLTIWDEMQGTISEGFIYSSEEMKHYEHQSINTIETKEVLVATSTVWSIVFIQTPTDQGYEKQIINGIPTLQKYIVKVVHGNDYLFLFLFLFFYF